MSWYYPLDTLHIDRILEQLPYAHHKSVLEVWEVTYTVELAPSAFNGGLGRYEKEVSRVLLHTVTLLWDRRNRQFTLSQ